MIQIFWSQEILDEVFRTLIKFGYSDAQATRRCTAMKAAFPESMSSAPLHFVNAIKLPDPNDRHVVATANEANVNAIITFNQKDFPLPKMRSLGFNILTPDQLLVRLLKNHPLDITRILDDQAKAITEPLDAILTRLSPGTPEFVRAVRSFLIAAVAKK